MPFPGTMFNDYEFVPELGYAVRHKPTGIMVRNQVRTQDMDRGTGYMTFFGGEGDPWQVHALAVPDISSELAAEFGMPYETKADRENFRRLVGGRARIFAVYPVPGHSEPQWSSELVSILLHCIKMKGNLPEWNRDWPPSSGILIFDAPEVPKEFHQTLRITPDLFE